MEKRENGSPFDITFETVLYGQSTDDLRIDSKFGGRSSLSAEIFETEEGLLGVRTVEVFGS